MTGNVRITLRDGERIFINGAVIKAEGRSSFEILNDVPYLHEQEIMQSQHAMTPLRQLYYVLQTMVLEPNGIETARGVYDDTMRMLGLAFENKAVVEGLETIRRQVAGGAPFEALKTVRTLIPFEDDILGRNHPVELRLVEAG
jgi:flagellar protein FlbT